LIGIWDWSNGRLEKREQGLIAMNRISVIIPAKNEEKTIAKVISEVRKEADEVIVVDGYSSDWTREIAEKEGARVVLQSKKMFPGKGNAMKTGLEIAKGDIIVFVDADMESIKSEWIRLLTQPIIREEVDICKADYKRKGTDAPVTKLVAKPLLKTLYPNLNVNMPLEGEVAARKSIFEKLEFREDWGIDVGLIISAHKQGFRIKNVFLGEKIHKPSYINDIGELSPMAENIMQTILESKNGEIIANLKEQVLREIGIRDKARERVPGPLLAGLQE